MAPILPSYKILDTRDLEKVVAFTRRVIGKHREATTENASNVPTRVHQAKLSNISIVYVDSSSRLAVEGMSTADFLVWIVLEGRVACSSLRETVCALPGRGIVMSPDREYRLAMEPGRKVIIRLPEKLVLGEAARRLDRCVPMLTFGPEMDLTRGTGASFNRLVRFILDELEQPGGLRPPSTTMKKFEKMLVELLFDAQPHSIDGTGIRRAESGPGIVRRVDELIRTRMEEPLSAVELARLSGVSPRTLFRTYRRYRGRTPIQTLREKRLERVRKSLLKPSAGMTVTQVAIGCGFTHLGRFSGTYKKVFGEMPSATLRRARMNAHS